MRETLDSLLFRASGKERQGFPKSIYNSVAHIVDTGVKSTLGTLLKRLEAGGSLKLEFYFDVAGMRANGRHDGSKSLEMQFVGCEYE
jgi:hypothetical protein